VNFHVRLERSDFAATVAWAARCLPARPAHAVLAGMVLDTAAGNLIASAFDYEVSATGWCSADVKDEGRVIVNGKLLAQVAATLPAKPVELESDGSALSLRCGPVKARLPLLPVEDYPSLPESVKAAAEIDLSSVVTAVAHAASRDPKANPQLMGVKFTAADGTLHLATTDRYQFGYVATRWAGPDGEALIPAAELAELAKHIGAPVGLGWSDNLVTLTAPGRTASLRLMDAEFPRYEPFLKLPTVATVVHVEVAALAEAVKRTQAFIPDGRPVMLGIADGITVSSGANEAGDLDEPVEAKVDGPGLDIGFNPGYLLATLAGLRSPYARITLTAPTTRAHFHPAATVDDGPSADRVAVVMPIKPGGSQ
jgi:DNA polymerase-3 subunit beta